MSDFEKNDLIFDLGTYDFFLPEDRIAQHPVYPRDRSRLLLVDRERQVFQDLVFRDLKEILGPRDILVLNETKVLPARLFGVEQERGSTVEVLLLHPEAEGWACLTRPAKKMRPGLQLVFGEGRLKGEVIRSLPFAGGRLIKFYDYEDWEKTLEAIGQMPLPPYIKRPATEKDAKDYQTVYAREAGSVAAPTAGLHFTEELLQELAQGGVEMARVVLHIGIGTFRPVQVSDIRGHVMHRERYEISPKDAELINRAKMEGKRVVAVGTTTVRTLESAYQEEKGVVPGQGETELFIYPGYRFKVVQGLITNFHLPKSSLFIMVCALAGVDLMHRAYRHAVEKGYRFFSYGDAMLIL